MVGKTNSCELDVIEELKVEERMNLFAVFPIGTTMQDGGKRKRSGEIPPPFFFFFFFRSSIYYTEHVGRLW